MGLAKLALPVGMDFIISDVIPKQIVGAPVIGIPGVLTGILTPGILVVGIAGVIVWNMTRMFRCLKLSNNEHIKNKKKLDIMLNFKCNIGRRADTITW